MTLLKAFFMGLGMFTALPLPWHPWEERARGLMLVCLPLVGAVLGLFWAGLSLLAQALLPAPLAAAVIAALPWMLTGFIHLDGYMDTSDALLSWRPLEERLRILKDAHAGAFAIVGLGMAMLFSYSAALSYKSADLRLLVLVPVVSRCGSALCVLSLKPLGHSEYARITGTAAQRAAVIAMLIAAFAAAGLWLGRGAVIALLAEGLAFALAAYWAVRTLRGISGDLCGFSLTIAETAALIAMAIV